MAGDKIHELEQKILFMAETLKELGTCASVSIDAFAKATGIDRERIRSAVTNGGVSAELESLLASVAHFSVNDLTWKDTRIDYLQRAASGSTRYRGYDTAENFRRMVRLANRLPVFGNLSLRPSRPVLSKRNLAALSVTAAQTGIEDPAIPIIAQITMNPGFHASGLSYGFRRVRIQFDLAQESAIRFSNRLGFPTPIAIDGRVISGASTEYESYWYLSQQDGILKGDFITGDSPLCELLEATVDEEITAVLAVCPPDGDLAFSGSARDANSAQKAILKSLMAEKLGGSPNADGWITLGKQTLTVFRG